MQQDDVCTQTDDADAVRLANDCAFGLGAYCFSRSQARAARLGAQLESGMFVVNDYASNAMCQSLPFGGVKESGFGRCATEPDTGLRVFRVADGVSRAMPRTCRCAQVCIVAARRHAQGLVQPACHNTLG